MRERYIKVRADTDILRMTWPALILALSRNERVIGRI